MGKRSARGIFVAVAALALIMVLVPPARVLCTPSPVVPQASPAPGPDHSPVAQPPGGRRWALLVGITQYQRVKPLRGCENDARLMADLLVRNCGFERECVRVLDGSQVTRQGIEKAFLEWLATSAGPDDTVVFFFSGHGTQVKMGKDMHEALCPVDMDPKEPASLVLDRDLSRWIARLRAGQVVVVLDACHSGTHVKALSADSMPKFAPMRDGPPAPDTVAWQSLGKSIDGLGRTILLAACQSREKASDTAVIAEDGTRTYYGAFTYALGQVLQNLDPASVRRMSYEDLMARVRRLVRDDLQELQTPVLRGAYKSRPIFSTGPLLPGPALASQSASGNSVVPASGGRPLYVAVSDFDNTKGNEAAQIRALLRGLPYLRLVTQGGAADVVVCGTTVDNRLRARVCSPGGHVINELEGATPAAMVELLAGELRRIYSFTWLSRLQNPAAPFRVTLTSTRGDGATYQVGEPVSFEFRSERDCYLTLLDVGTSGHITILYPNAFHRDTFVKAGQVVTVPASDRDFKMTVSSPPGREMVVALATTRPCELATLLLPDATRPFLTFRDIQAFRKTFVNALSKGIAPQGTGVGAGQHGERMEWAEASAVLMVR